MSTYSKIFISALWWEWLCGNNNCLFTCWKIISFWNPTNALTSCSKCITGVALLHLAWKQWAMCSVLKPSPQQRTGCWTLWRSSMNPWHQSQIFRTGDWKDHTKAYLLREQSKERKTFYFSDLTSSSQHPLYLSSVIVLRFVWKLGNFMKKKNWKWNQWKLTQMVYPFERQVINN